jgi:CheY-like chemotaxis protein
MEKTFPTVLLIDDEEIANYLHKVLLNKAGFAENIIIKQSVKRAIDYLMNETLYPKDIPQVIFLDIRMPLHDGFHFLDAFGTLPDKIRNTSKVIMLSSSLDQGDHERAAAYDYVIRFLQKPLTNEAIEELKSFIPVKKKE